MQGLDRRHFLAASTAGVAAASLPGCRTTDRAWGNKSRRAFQSGRSPWGIALDTVTIRTAGSLEDKARIAAEAGYDAIEPWEGELNEYEQKGGSLKELGQKLKDWGLIVPSVIGLWNGMQPNKEDWDKALPEHRRRMRQASDLGAQHIQVVPQPARKWSEFDPHYAAARYRELLEIGLNEFNINPAMVFVQFLEGSRTLGQAVQMALDADHPKAKIIPDVFHMYTGDSGFNGLKHIQGDLIAIFAVCDVPATPTKDELVAMGTQKADAQRVYPGDGALPLVSILQDLRAIDYQGYISLELYNPEYHKLDPVQVAQTGLQKTLEVIAKAGV